MIPVELAISRVRRDLTFGALLKAIFIAAAMLCVFVAPLIGAGVNSYLILAVLGAVWLALSYRSAKGSRIAASSSLLIASGQFAEAERRLEDALSSFSLFRTVKLLSLHHLAMSRHAQKRWNDTAVLCRTLLGQRLGTLQGLSKSSRLILADSLLELGDVRGAYEAMVRLYDERLTLAEALNLLVIQLDYCSRIGAWEAMMAQLPTKVQLSELMSSEDAARTQAFLALAARKTGRQDWADWLRQRIELLVDVQKLVKDRPMFWELWEMRRGVGVQGSGVGEMQDAGAMAFAFPRPPTPDP